MSIPSIEISFSTKVLCLYYFKDFFSLFFDYLNFKVFPHLQICKHKLHSLQCGALPFISLPVLLMRTDISSQH